MTALVVSVALVLTYSLQVKSAGIAQRVLLGLKERSLLLDTAREKSFVIFSCISCPACRDLMVAELGRGRQEHIKYFYFDVHQDEANLAWQFAFELSMSSGDLVKARELLRRVRYVSEGNQSIPQSWLEERSKETQLAKSLGIRETPTIFKISKNEVSQLTATQFLSR
jgi:thioredoxin-related protein